MPLPDEVFGYELPQQATQREQAKFQLHVTTRVDDFQAQQEKIAEAQRKQEEARQRAIAADRAAFNDHVTNAVAPIADIFGQRQADRQTFQDHVAEKLASHKAIIDAAAWQDIQNRANQFDTNRAKPITGVPLPPSLSDTGTLPRFQAPVTSGPQFAPSNAVVPPNAGIQFQPTGLQPTQVDPNNALGVVSPQHSWADRLAVASKSVVPTQALDVIGSIPFAGEPLRNTTEAFTNPIALTLAPLGGLGTTAKIAAGTAAGALAGHALDESGLPNGAPLSYETALGLAGGVAGPAAIDALGSRTAQEAARAPTGVGPGTFAPTDGPFHGPALAEPIDIGRIPQVGDVTPLTDEQLVKQVTRSLAENRAGVKEQNLARTVQRGERTDQFNQAYDAAIKRGLSPMEAQQEALPSLSGEMATHPGASSLNLAEPDKTRLWSMIDDSHLGTYGKINARTAMVKVETGEPLQNWEIRLLGRVYGPQFAQNLPSKGRGLFGNIGELIVTPKAVLSSFDLSYPLRQGIMAAPAHPGEFFKSFKPMVQAMASEKTANLIDSAIIGDVRPMVIDGVQKAAGDVKVEHGLVRALGGGSQASEEVFRGSLAESLPLGIGAMVRASNRAFTTFGNQFRSSIFDTITNTWVRRGIPLTEERVQSLSDMLNRFTGRGTMQGKILGHEIGSTRIADVAQGLMWAPQYRMSGPQAVAQLFNPDRMVRNEAWKNMAAYMGVGATLLGAAKMSGLGKVVLDPRSSDFGKIQIGKTHINLWGTNQLLVRTLFQIATKHAVSPTGEFPISRVDTAVRYGRSGLAPEWAAAWDIGTGANYLNQPVTAKAEIMRNITPLVAQDAIQAWKEEGLLGAALTTPFSAVGGGIQTYDQSASSKMYAMPKWMGVDKTTEDAIYNGKAEVMAAYQQARSQNPNADIHQNQFLGIIPDPHVRALVQASIAGNLPENTDRISFAIQNQSDLDGKALNSALNNETAYRALNPDNLKRYLDAQTQR